MIKFSVVFAATFEAPVDKAHHKETYVNDNYLSFRSLAYSFS